MACSPKPSFLFLCKTPYLLVILTSQGWAYFFVCIIDIIIFIIMRIIQNMQKKFLTHSSQATNHYHFQHFTNYNYHHHHHHHYASPFFSNSVHPWFSFLNSIIVPNKLWPRNLGSSVTQLFLPSSLLNHWWNPLYTGRISPTYWNLGS